MQLFDYSIGDQNFNAWDQSAIFESRHRDGVNVTQIVWLHRPDVIAKAATQGQTDYSRKRGFQGAGEADASGEAEASAGGDVSELVLVPGGGSSGSGAVVVSGAREAGGGSEESVSGAGKGASLFAAPGLAEPVPAVRAPCASPFFLPPCATGKAG